MFEELYWPPSNKKNKKKTKIYPAYPWENELQKSHWGFEISHWHTPASKTNKSLKHINNQSAIFF